MQEQTSSVVAFVAGLIFLGCHSPQLAAADASASSKDVKSTPASVSASKTYFLVIGKGKVIDPQKQQERAIAAVRKVAEAARSAHPGAIVEALSEGVMTKERYRQGEVEEKVTGTIFRERLVRLAASATPHDTVVIYTHTHGRKNGFEDSQPFGGIVIDLPVRQPERGGTLLWDEYADLVLKIPARDVVVLTMSCFSGGLVEYFDSPKVRQHWEDRKKEGRNLIVLTSQNEDLISPPIVKGGEVINPFTLAVVKSLAGEADGFELTDGNRAKLDCKDGGLTVGELIDCILYTTEYTTSETSHRKNIAKPRLTGSFNRRDVLFRSAEVPGHASSEGNTIQQGAAADMDKRRHYEKENFRVTQGGRVVDLAQNPGLFREPVPVLVTEYSGKALDPFYAQFVADNAFVVYVGDNTPKADGSPVHIVEASRNANLNQLQDLDSFEELHLRGDEITNEGLLQNTTLDQLKRLHLSSKTVTDEGLRLLASMSNLQFLNLSGTDVSDEAVAELKKALPKCRIQR